MNGPLVVIGDTLLDVDIEGNAERLAPDAPVPVVDVEARHPRPGGAGLAALLAARDGAEVVLVTALADDESGRTLRGLLNGRLRVVPVPLRGSTVCKTRVRAAGQTLVRLDTGDGHVAGGLAGEVARTVRSALRTAGAVLVSDYGRGMAGSLLDLLGEVDAPIVWDPHPKGPSPLHGCALITPSESEARLLCPPPYAGPDEAARSLVKALRARAVAVTLGADGAVLAHEGGHHTRIPPPLLDGGHDVCGAGDRFAAAAALALRDRLPVEDAVALGVGEAARFVEAGGAAAIRPPRAQMRDRPRTATEIADLVRANGGRLIATGGCFDLLHAGHVSLLRRARALGDALIVCLNSDASARRLKGPNRPVVGQQDRAEVLGALGCVDAVMIFDEDTPAQAIERLRPHVWVKGGDYSGRELPEAESLRKLGAETVVLASVPGRSTTRIIAAMHAA
ncbi:PfkB family carbohydrate kinase [Nonomuraea angiospora]|uniref:PfkB family carbohydrate kinase n=1 Tax=Nonomuraea angiospora TaxID=46172 RepID=UPI0029B7D804|nr:PfkB family carbohydrate kinase [Nonomuraea angiospora]MDX3102661.1 PfkB family carbohydrate kinase [Nonomuraea angiospora]